MNVAWMKSKDDVRVLAARVFEDSGRRWPRPDFLIDASPDFDGDDALFVTAVFPDGASRPDGPQQIDLQIALGKLLMDEGDHRLVYLSALNRSELDELKRLQAEDLPDDA